MTLATRDQILAASDLVFETVETPEWGAGAAVRVRSLTAIERDNWDKSTYAGRKEVELLGYKARFCVLTMVNEGGTQIFVEGDAEALAKKSAAVVERVFTAAAKLNGLIASDVAVIEKNSEAAPSAV